MYKFYCYSRCSTCKKAQNYLDSNGIEYEYIDIKSEIFNPKLIKDFHLKSKKELKKLFNTSGIRYRELKLKDKIPNLTVEELYQLLSTDGMLIKRPILVTDEKVYFGFKEEEYRELLK